MKARLGFISNSSSSSFVISKYYLTEEQIEKIRNHREIKDVDLFNAWTISENENDISGRTSMDNFDMYQYLEDIGINDAIIRWGE